MEREIEINKKNLDLYSTQREEMNSNLAELKDIKDRYERYNQKLKIELE